MARLVMTLRNDGYISDGCYATIRAVTRKGTMEPHPSTETASPPSVSPPDRPFFLVLGYGTFWHSGYEHYLDGIAEAVEQDNPSWILLCGAATGDGSEQPSEAQWMAQMLEQWGVDPRLMRLEEFSRTTFENFLQAEKSGWLVGDRPVVVFCDRCRLAKVRAIVHRLGLLQPRFEALPMEFGWRACLVRFKSQIDALRVRLWGLPGQ